MPPVVAHIVSVDEFRHAPINESLLLVWLVARFVPSVPVVIGLDNTIERRWGMKIKARYINRDPVRLSHGHFVKAGGLRWQRYHGHGGSAPPQQRIHVSFDPAGHGPVQGPPMRQSVA